VAVLRAGALKYRIAIEQMAGQRDTYGGSKQSWHPFAEVWSSYRSISGREFFASQQTNATISARFGIRYLAGVTTAMRVSFAGDLYNIVAILDSEKDADLVLMCEKVART